MKTKRQINGIPFFQKNGVRVVFGSTLVFIVLVLSIFLLYIQTRDHMVDLRREEIKRLVAIGFNSIEPILAVLKTGNVSREQALTQVRATIRRMTYRDHLGDNYLFMSGYDGTMLVQPFEPYLEETDQWDLRDDKGVYIIRELVRMAKTGEGFVEYYYHRPDSDKPQLKISYVKGIDALDCYIGTGMYIEDIQISISGGLINGILIILGLYFVVITFNLSVFRPFIRGYRLLSRRFSAMGMNPNAVLPPLKVMGIRNAEVRSLVTGFNGMVDRLKSGAEEIVRERIILKHLLDNMPGFAFFKDAQSTYLAANRMFREYVGIGTGEIKGKTDYDFFPPEQAEQFQREDREAMKAGLVPMESTENIFHNGKALTTSKRKVPVLDDNGEPIGIIGLAIDITAISQTLKQKETLLKEINHRVKNNLQIISSLLNLQGQMSNDEGYRKMLKESMRRIDSMAMVHEMLNDSINISEVDLSAYVMTLSERQFDSYAQPDKIKLEMDLEKIRVLPEKAVICGLVVSELITNAVKYAFPGERKGVIRVSLRSRRGEVHLDVEDDGVGFDRSAGTGEKSGLGLMIVEALVAQENGVLGISTEDGTSFHIVFPESFAISKEERPLLE